MKSKTIIVALLSLSAVGCARSVLPETVSLSPADPLTGNRPALRLDVIGNYNHRIPVEPKPWRLQNDGQSPVKGDAS